MPFVKEVNCTVGLKRRVRKATEKWEETLHWCSYEESACTTSLLGEMH